MPTALITGASTGIGRASALRLADDGWTVLAGVRNLQAGEQLAAEGGERIVPVTLDVTNGEQIEQAARLVNERGGRLDGLVNNAGIGVGGPLEVVSDEDLRRQFDVNVFAPLAVMRALLPALRAARGRIVFISSIGGRVAQPFTAPYAASKHSIEVFADALRVELHSSGVRVVLVEPGSVATPIWGKAQEEADKLSLPPELEPVYGKAIPSLEKALADAAARGIPPEQVAEVVHKALTSERIRTRYLVGRDARALLVIRRLMPDRVFDRFVRRMLRI